MAAASAPARVVFVPGIMGTALTHVAPPRRKIGERPRRAWLWPAPELSSDGPFVLWGRDEMLWFVIDEDYFFDLLTDTDGRTNPGGGRVFPGDPTTVMDSPLTRISERRIPSGIGPVVVPAVVPYDDFLLNLKWRQPTLDLRVFGYDWRLSNTVNALKLLAFLYDQWGLDSAPEDERERVSIVAHSMGGLVARSFIESPRLQGHRLVKQLITVGTPHLGSPAAYNLMTDATPWGVLPIPEELLSRGRQQELSLRLDSLAEMLPVYDFVTPADSGGRREPWRSTLSELTLYRYPEFGRGPREEIDALSVVLAFRQTLVPEEDLQAWLAWRRVRYLFLGGLGLLTAMETRRRAPGEGRALVDLRLDGDATVPYRSALAFGTTARRTSRDSAAAAETLRRGMTQHPPLHDTDWLTRKAFDADKRFPDALTNPERIHHQDAMKIADVGTETAGRLDPNAAAAPGRPDWGALVNAGHAIGTATRRHVRPTVVCAAVLRLRPGDRPPLAYVVRHCTPDQRPMLSMLQWPLRRECLADRLPQTFPDVYPGGDGARGTYPHRYLLLDRQVEAAATHMGGGAVLLDEHPVGDELFVVTWNTGELNKSSKRHSNEHHAEAHLVGWWMRQDAAWRARVMSIDITVTFSPCPLCCGALRDLTGAGRDANVKAATVAWRSLYRGNMGGGATDADALKHLTGNTPWEIVPRQVGAIAYPSKQP
jgi:hypothetical protein